MKTSTSIHKAIVAFLICCIPVISQANDPTSIPWPVGTTASQMNFTKTLMNSYGDPQNDWDEGKFHCGLDFDSHTESPICSNVLCVIDNAVISRWFSTPLGPNPAEWVVVTTQGTGSTNHEDFGWAYQHLSDPRVIYGPDPWDEVEIGDLIQTMNNYVQTIHTHLKWTTWDNDNWCYENPLNYLTPSATGSNYTWTFNPSGYTNTFESFFLEDDVPGQWPETPGAVNMLDENDLNGAVDVFFGFGLSGVGQSTTSECGRNDLAPEKIKWNIQQVTISGLELLVEKFLVNFNCPLNNDFNEKVQQLYFKHDLDDMYSYTSGDNEGLIVCLSNCGDMQDFDNIGIDNIDEKAWQTNDNYLYSGETENPVLAAFPDGAYELAVLLYAHDPSVTLPEDPENDPISIPCELHNFAPALQSVSIIDLDTDQTYYSGVWEPNGTSAELTTSGTSAPAGAELQVILLFTEEMETSAPSVTLGPLSVSGTWSNGVVSNDTWTGEVTLPIGLTDGAYTLLVSASDTDNNNLMNPEGEGTVPGPAYDCHHALNLQFAAGVEWTRSLHDDVHGSPKLADFDDDGDMEIALISVDGWGDLLGDDGYSLAGWPVDNGFAPTDPVVTASPGIADFIGSSVPEIIFMGEVVNYVRYANGVVAFYANWFRWTVNCSPVIGDFDGDNQNEFMIGRQYKINSYNYFNLAARDTDGSPMWYDGDLGPNSSITATPSVCNLDNMGGLEVVVVADATEYSQTDACGTVYCYSASNGADKWNTSVGGNIITSAVVTANTDDDPVIEVIVAGVSTGGNQVKVLRGDTGLLEATFTVSGSVDAGVSIADINQNGNNDIVLSSSGNGGMLYCWTWNGSSYEDALGFPVNLGTWTDDGVSIADIDSDSRLELVIAGKDGNLHVINHDGTVTSGFPLAISGGNSLSGQPAIGDIDCDGRLEIVFFELNASVIHCVELGENTANNYLPWPQFQHDAQNTGYFPTDTIPPATPEDFAGIGTLAGNIFTADLSWTLSVNDPSYDPIPTPPADVSSYRIYRTIPPRAQEHIATLPAGTSAYTDVISFFSSPYPRAIAYYVSAWDGVNESPLSDRAKVIVGELDNIAAGCPVREITHSAAVRSSRSQISIAVGAVSSVAIETSLRSNCRVLTDGEFNEVFISSSSSDCVEIDLGAVFLVSNVVVIGAENFSSESPISETPEQSFLPISSSCATFQLSTDGRHFSTEDSGRARYIRVDNAAGTTEVEVYGERVTVTSAAVDIQRSTENGYRIAAVESGTPITATVFDLSGRSIWRNTSPTGEILWNRCNSSGNTVPNGVYLIMVESDEMDTFTSKVIVR